MTYQGAQFDKMRVSPLMDASLYDALFGQQRGILKGRGDDMTITSNGLNVIIGKGEAIIKGRLVQVTSPHTVPLPANQTGTLVATIDLGKTNSSTGDPVNSNYVVTNNQLTFQFITDSTLITKQDVFDGGTVYMAEIAHIQTNGSSVTYILKDTQFYTPSTIKSLTGTRVPFMNDNLGSIYWNEVRGYLSGNDHWALFYRLGSLVMVMCQARFVVTSGNALKGKVALLTPPGFQPSLDAMHNHLPIPMASTGSGAYPGSFYLSGSNIMIYANDIQVNGNGLGACFFYPTSDDYPDTSATNMGIDKAALAQQGLNWPMS